MIGVGGERWAHHQNYPPEFLWSSAITAAINSGTDICNEAASFKIVPSPGSLSPFSMREINFLSMPDLHDNCSWVILADFRNRARMIPKATTSARFFDSLDSVERC